MSLKRFLIWSFGSPPVWCSRTIYAVLKDGIIGKIHVKLYGNLTSGSKDDYGRSYHKEQFCEIILNLDQLFRRNRLSKVFLIWISGSPFVQHSITICAILLEGIMGNNSVKLF